MITYKRVRVLTQERLKYLFHYCPDTGVFIRRVTINSRAIAGAVAGSITYYGYITISVDGKSYRAHRLAFLYMEGYLPEQDVDHINRIKTCNRWDNLRHVSRQCNNRNSSIRATNTSGVVGVNWNDERQRWCAQIRGEGSKINLGYFIHKGDAIEARWEGEKKYNYPGCCTYSSAYRYIKGGGI